MGMLFTGHGYKGEIGTVSVADPSSPVGFAGMPTLPGLPGSSGTTIAGGDALTSATLFIALARQ
jgi:hypothetical protein